MRKNCLSAVLLALSSSAVFAQARRLPMFDVASVKPNPDGPGPGTMMQELPGHITYRKQTLLAVIRRAYKVQSMQVEGPGWLSTDTYNIEAKFPAETPEDQFLLMLRGLLAERFQLLVHHEAKQLTGYMLMVSSKGFKMHPSETGRLGYAPTRDGTERRLRGRITLPILADNLSGVLGRPVSNETALDGLYDVDLKWSVEDSLSPNADAPPEIFTAVEEQLGLKLDARKARFDVIVVDHAERTPIDN